MKALKDGKIVVGGTTYNPKPVFALVRYNGDEQGNVRSSAVATGSNYSINTSQLMLGNYLLKLQHNNVITTLPFVKE